VSDSVGWKSVLLTEDEVGLLVSRKPIEAIKRVSKRAGIASYYAKCLVDKKIKELGLGY
jgi:hypothetical protein